MPPGALAQVLRDIPRLNNDRLIVGFDTSDDACVYKVNESLALVQTVDFFPPMVDDPFLFGQIAAANALSDVYAMGGTPQVAMNLLCFPSCLDLEIAGRILAGGAEKAAEAGCVIAGGHSVMDNEPKYGLCVTGFVDPNRILANSGAKPGDKLILTKKVGTGVLATAVKGELLSQTEIQEAIDGMRTLNRYASEAAAPYPVNACTDITGFGVIGHVCEMAEGSGLIAELDAMAVPMLPHAVEMAQMGIIPSGAYRNRDCFSGRVMLDAQVPVEIADLLFDPQTSGGLLFSVPADMADDLLKDLLEASVPAALIGQMTVGTGAAVQVKAVPV